MLNKQIVVGVSKNVIVFHPLVTGHVIRRTRSGRVRILNGNQWEPCMTTAQGQKVKGQGHQVTWRISRQKRCRLTRQWMVISTSNLVEIINVGVGACGILSRSENVAKSPKFCTITGNRGRRIEWRCLNLHRKFINNRFCACAVQMLLKMAVNAAICSTFEVKYGKSMSARTTAIGHLGYL